MDPSMLCFSIDCAPSICLIKKKEFTVSTGTKRLKWIDNYSFDWNEMFCICAYACTWRVCIVYVVYVIVVAAYRFHGKSNRKFTMKYCSSHNIRTDLKFTVTRATRHMTKRNAKTASIAVICLLNAVYPFDIINFYFILVMLELIVSRLPSVQPYNL